MLVKNSNSQSVNYTIASCQRGRSPGSYRIIFGDTSSFFVSVDFFLLNTLRKGLTVSPDLYNDISIESQFVEAYTKAISLLRRQLYTKFNLSRKLQSKDYDTEAIAKTISRLEEKGYLNDYQYAHNWVLSRLKNKQDSYTSLLSGLLKKGISHSIVNDVVKELYNDDVEIELIKKVIEKASRAGKSSDKIIEKLLRKGFNRTKVFDLVNGMK